MAVNGRVRDGVAEIEFFGLIGDDYGEGISLSSVTEVLRETRPDSESIRLQINSEGGRVTEGRAIQSVLAKDPRPVTAEVIGVAASMAAQIALGMDRVEMFDGSWLMIHNPWGMAVGDYREMQATANLLESMQLELAKTVVRKAGVEIDQATQWMDAETWFTADAAADAGLADEVIDDAKAELLSYTFAQFRNVPDALTRRSRPPGDVMAKEIGERLANLQSMEVIRRMSEVGAG